MQCRAYGRSPCERYRRRCTSESVGPILAGQRLLPPTGKGEGGRRLARAPGVLEVQFKSVLSGYLKHRLTQDAGINLRDKEGIMDG